MKAGTGEYVYEEGAHKPEYETMAMFGSNLCNDNLDSLIVASDICNRLGIDTISAGACIAFTIECFENGIISDEDTGGLQMTWGNHRGHHRHDRDARQARGIRRRHRRWGEASPRRRSAMAPSEYAMHIGGQEISGHDPRGGWGFAIGYGTDPTPGRHNQGGGQHPPGLVEEIERSAAHRARASTTRRAPTSCTP